MNLNLKDFLKYLNHFKWFIIIIPVLCVVLTYLFVKELPKKYKSNTLISTGITQQLSESALLENRTADNFKISQQFGNLLEMMQTRRAITQLSYKLILHDLKNPQHTFTKYSELITDLSPQQKDTVIKEFENRLSAQALISPADNNQHRLYDILKSAAYDDKSVLKNIEIRRSGESDFINVTYTSHNANLSAFVVNTLSNDFINYYTSLSMMSRQQSLAVLDTMLREKGDEMMNKNSAVVNSSIHATAQETGALNSQRRSDLINQKVSEAESQRLGALRNISSIQGALDEINAKLNGDGGYLQQDSYKENSEIVRIDNQLQLANQRYVNNNFRPQDKATIDSLQNIKSGLVLTSSASQNNNYKGLKQSLISQKMKLENDLASARSGLAAIEQQLNSIGPRPGYSSVSARAGGQENLIREAGMSAKDYADVKAQYDKASILSKAGVSLALVEPGLPGSPEPSKNYLYVAFSGISSLFMLLLALLLIFMLNKTVVTPSQLEYVTKQKILGWVNYIGEDKDLRTIWNDNGKDNKYAYYKDALRSLRVDLNEIMRDDNKVLGITSMSRQEGRSFLANGLSYAFAMMGKNVLLICEKGSNLTNVITNMNDDDTSQVFESFLVKKEIQIENRITVLNRDTSNNSLLELKDSKSLIAGFDILKDTFDIVIVDIDSAQDMHKVKEWMMFCDRSISVFEAGNKIKREDHVFINYLSKQPGFIGWVMNKVEVRNFS